MSVPVSEPALAAPSRLEAVPSSPGEMAITTLPPVASGVPTSVFGFATIITILSLNNAGIIGSGAMFLPAAMAVGVLAIGIGGLYELRNGDLFGGTFGVCYAAFLLATGIGLRFFGPAATADAATLNAFGDAVGAWFLLWALVSVFFTIGARLVNTTAVIAFAFLALVLALAGLANIVGGDAASTLTKLAGYAGLIDGAAAFWLAGGLLLNTMYGRDVLRLGAARA